MQHLKFWFCGLNLKIPWFPFALQQKQSNSSKKVSEQRVISPLNLKMSHSEVYSLLSWSLTKALCIKVLRGIVRICIPMSPTLELECIHSEIQARKALPLVRLYHSGLLIPIITVVTLRGWELAGFQHKEDQIQTKKKKKKEKIIQGDFHFTQRLTQAHEITRSFSRCKARARSEGRKAASAGRRANRNPHHPRESENSGLWERDGKEPRQEHLHRGSPSPWQPEGGMEPSAWGAQGGGWLTDQSAAQSQIKNEALELTPCTSARIFKRH